MTTRKRIKIGDTVAIYAGKPKLKKMTPEDRERLTAMSKETPIPPIVVDQVGLRAEKGVLCRRCGNIIREPYDRYCSECGQRIKPYAHGGAFGWTERTADFVWSAEGRS